jgi:hypothetical protein
MHGASSGLIRVELVAVEQRDAADARAAQWPAAFIGVTVCGMAGVAGAGPNAPRSSWRLRCSICSCCRSLLLLLLAQRFPAQQGQPLESRRHTLNTKADNSGQSVKRRRETAQSKYGTQHPCKHEMA